MSTPIKPVETKAAEVASSIRTIISGKTPKYQYLRPDGQNIQEFVNVVQKPQPVYVGECAPIPYSNLKADQTEGLVLDYFG